MNKTVVSAIVEPILDYDHIDDFCDGLARVERDGLQGLIDKTGKIVFPCEFDEITTPYFYEADFFL